MPAEDDVRREPEREVQDHADHRRRDRRSAPAEPRRVRAAARRRARRAKIHRKHGAKVTQVVSDRAERPPPTQGSSAPGSRNAARKPTNCTTRISGPGVVSARPSPSSISPAAEPAVGLDRLLRDVGEHRVGAAEGDHRHLAEEDAEPREDVVRAERQRQQRDRRRARAPAPISGARSAAEAARACGRRSVAERRVASGRPGRGRAVPAGREASSPARAATSRSGRPPSTISGNGASKKKIATKAAAASGQPRRACSARRPIAQHRLAARWRAPRPSARRTAPRRSGTSPSAA